MRFTADQYDAAIEDLKLAKTQLEADGNHCAICEDSDHMAFECGWNPLLAIAMCQGVSKSAEELHNMLHWLAGWDFGMMLQRGPARMRMPARTAEQPDEEMKKRVDAYFLRMQNGSTFAVNPQPTKEEKVRGLGTAEHAKPVKPDPVNVVEELGYYGAVRATVWRHGSLHLSIADEDIKAFREDAKDIEGALEGLTTNGVLEWVRPEEIGALTSAPILGEDVERDDRGKLLSVGRVWWFENYQVHDPFEVMKEHQGVFFSPAPDNKPPKKAKGGNKK